LATPRFLAALAVAVLLAQTAWAVDKPEAARVHFLIVVDTDDGAGKTWGLDGRTFKAVVYAGLKKQNLESRVSFETFSGKDVTSGKVLRYYHDLRVEPDDALVFFYSGHGATNATRGHFLQFTHGPLFRNDLLAAMQKHNPRLMVLLTDCCSNFAGSFGTPRPGTPPGLRVPPPGLRVPPPGLRVPPPTPPRGAGDLGGAADIPDPPPPPGSKKSLENYEFVDLPGDVSPRFRKKPPMAAGTAPSGTAPGGNGAIGTGVVLRTATGPVPLRQLMEATNGDILRDLFFRHTGLVDINGCGKGKSSHGTIPWGGSLFTIGFLSLQRDPISKFDTNGNGIVEWTEFMPHLQTSCDRAAKSVGVHQVPEATQLGQPVLAER
jgi:hypothetical protein